MSEQTAQSEPASSDQKPPRGAKRQKPGRSPKPPRRGGLLALIALILALLALAAAAFAGWQWRQQQGVRQADAQATAQLRQQVGKLQSTVREGAAHRQQGQQALKAANQTLQRRLDGMSERVDSLETAVANLARHSQHGRRAVLLDQAEMLLRMGQERDVLFHDAAGALAAYGEAAQVLADVEDPAYAGVRRSVDAARKALAETNPATRSADLAALAQLRGAIAELPLKSLDAETAKTSAQGFWQRVWHALSTAVVVRRVDQSPQHLANARLTRQLVALDVAQAQAARLAWDHEAYREALARVDHALHTMFDTHDPAVRKALATVKHLLAKPVTDNADLHLGKALKQLQAVRAVHDMSASPVSVPATPASTPAPTTSAAGEDTSA